VVGPETIAPQRRARRTIDVRGRTIEIYPFNDPATGTRLAPRVRERRLHGSGAGGARGGGAEVEGRGGLLLNNVEAIYTGKERLPRSIGRRVLFDTLESTCRASHHPLRGKCWDALSLESKCRDASSPR